MDDIPNTWEERLLLYVTHLVNHKYQSGTIKSYISAIKSVLANDDYELKNQKLLLSALTETCRLKNDRVKNRFPINKPLLELVLFQVRRILSRGQTEQVYLILLYRAIFVLAYYGLMRIGELVMGRHTVKAKDVHTSYEKSKILVILFTSKTHGRGHIPQKIKVWADAMNKNKKLYDFPPFKILNEYMQMRGGYLHDDEPLFIFQDRSPVTPTHVRRMLRKALNNLGLNPKLYNTHSFRSGRASDLTKFGYTLDQVKQVGRWRSNAVYHYIRK